MLSDSEVHRREEIIDFRIAIRFSNSSFLKSFQRLTMTYVLFWVTHDGQTDGALGRVRG